MIQTASLQEQDNRLALYFALFWSLGLLLGYLATSGAKPDVTFLLSNPDFLWRRRNFAPTSLSFWDLTRDRQTTDRRRQTTDATTKTEGSYCKCASLKIVLRYVETRMPSVEVTPITSFVSTFYVVHCAQLFSIFIVVWCYSPEAASGGVRANHCCCCCFILWPCTSTYDQISRTWPRGGQDESAGQISGSKVI